MKKSTCTAPHARPESWLSRVAQWAAVEENGGRKKGKSLQENPSMSSPALLALPHWVPTSTIPSHVRAKGCPAAPALQRQSGKTDLKVRVAVAAPQATENTEYSEVPGGYCNLLLIHGITLQKNNWRQSPVSIFTTTLIFLSAGDTISSLKITPF